MTGYEPFAEEFIAARSASTVGVATVRAWLRTLPRGVAVLDLGCGHGVPISEAIAGEGMELYGVDASPTLIAEFRARFPEARAECSTVEKAAFFGHTFDAVLAWGLLFLLPPDAQARLIAKVGTALKADGRFLFTSPQQECEWTDILTGQRSISLGAGAYARLLEEAGMELVGQCADEGENHYYSARRRTV